jgi:hypothetical protein
MTAASLLRRVLLHGLLLLPTPLGRAHLLQLLKQLLRGSHPWRRLLCGSGRLLLLWWRRWSLHRFRFVVVVGIGIGIRIYLWRRRGSSSSAPRGSKNQFSRRAVAQVSEQNLIVCSSNQQIGEHITWCSRPKAAKDPLVTAQAFDFHTAVAGNLLQNRGQAGIVGVYREIAVGENDLSILRRLLQHGGCNPSRLGWGSLRRGWLGRCCRLGRRRWSRSRRHTHTAQATPLGVNRRPTHRRQEQDCPSAGPDRSSHTLQPSVY